MQIKEIGHFMKIKHDKQLFTSFGFKSNPNLSKWINLKQVLAEMRTTTYYARNNTSSYHNLCSTITPPDNIGSLLGLGLKFCIKNRRPDEKSIHEGIERMQRDIRIKYLFAGVEEEENEDDYNKKLYIKSSWLYLPKHPVILRRES